MDPIAFPMGVAAYSYAVFLTSIFSLKIADYFNIVFLVLLYVTFAAINRALVGQAKWRKWQIIIYKIILSVAAGFYIVFGIRYIFPGINWTNGRNEDLDESIKEFIILFIIASADYIVKVYEKVCDLDKTADLVLD